MSRIRYRSISGSLLVTGSVSGNTLTFEKGDGTSFDLTVAGGGSTDISDLNAFTGSANTRFDNLEAATGSYLISDDTGSLVYSGSFDGVSTLTLYLPDGNLDLDLSALVGGSTDISDLNAFTGSAETRLDNLELETGSYATTGSNHFVGTQFISGALIPEALDSENGLYDLGSVSKPWRDLYITTSSLNFVKDGVVVSSVNGEPNAIRVGNVLITTASLAFVNNNGDVVSTIAVAQESGDDIVGGDIVETGSLITTASVDENRITFTKGDNTQFTVTVDTGSGGGGGSTDISDLNAFTGSAESRLDSLQAATSSYLTEVPSGTISSSAQIEAVIDDNYISASAAASGFGSGGGGSTDISDLNTFTGSAETRLDDLEAATASFLIGEDTGSLLVTGSVSNNVITLEKADGTSFSLTVDTGSGGDGSTPTLDEVVTQGSISTNAISASQFDFPTNGGLFSTIDGSNYSVITLQNNSYYTNILSLRGKEDGLAIENVGGLKFAQFYEPSSTNYEIKFAGRTGTGAFDTSSTVRLIVSGTLDVSGGITGSIATSSITNFDTEVSRSAAAAGFGTGGGGGSTDISDLNAFTGSAETRLDDLEAATASFLIGEDTGSLLVTASVSSNVITLEKGDSTSFTLTVDTGSNALTASFVDTLTNFDGDRVVSNTNLPSGIYNVNFGTSGSLSNFIESVFFPNTAPSVSASFFRIEEFTVSGSSVGTITATDAEGQTITFATASSYTDDFFRIHSGSGEITLNTKSTSSMNTTLTPDSVKTPASQSHAFSIEAIDTFGGTSSAIIYIHVNPNTAPVWRETSVTGNSISNFTQSLNENSVSGSNKARVFFTDAEGDTITIETGSLSSTFTDAFSLTVESTYVQLNQVTASLDFETTPTYEFVLTASDEHYQDDDDSQSIRYLPFQVEVTDNTGPSVNDQTLSTINENSADGASVGSISATDPEGDTIIFSNFTLVRAYVNGVGSNVTGSMGGTDLEDPTADAFTTDINGNVTRRNSIFLNADVADRYEYRVTVTDAFNTTTDTGLITIPIGDDAASTIGADGQTFYIIESAEQGDNLTTNSNGYSVSNVTLSSAVSQRWEVNTVPAGFVRFTTGNTYATASSVTLEVDSNISGSSNTSGDTIAIQITASEHGFHTTKQFRDHTLNITANEAPDIVFTNTSANLNTNGARPSNTLTTITFNDAAGDALNHDTFQFTDASGQLETVKSGDSYFVRATSNLSGSDYAFSASIEDEHGFNVNEELHTITIAQAPIGTLGGDTTSYIIESAVSGAVLRDATGYNNGNPSQLTVSYSPQYNSAAVQSFTSSNAAIAVDDSGNLTLNVNLSGSSTGSGDTISSDITFQDQYGNLGSGSLTVNVFANQAPSATFTDQTANFETDLAIAGAAMVSMSISDTESDTPFSASLSGSGITDLEIVFANANSSSAAIKATDSLSAGTYNYHVTVFDNFGKSRVYSDRSFTIAQSADYGKVYVYDVGFNNATYNTAVGISSEDSSVPPVATPFSNIGFVDAIINDNRLGSSSFDYTYGSTRTATLLASGSDTNVHDALRGMGSSGTISRNTNVHFVIIMPSGSDLGGVPTSTRDSYGGTAVDEYVLEVGTDGTTIDGTNTIESSDLNQFDLATDHLGYTTWFMVGATNQVTSTSNINLGLNPSSGSGGA